MDRPCPIELYREDYDSSTMFGKGLLDKPLKELWEPAFGAGFLLMTFYVIVHPSKQKRQQQQQQQQQQHPLLPGGGKESGNGRHLMHDANEDGAKRQKSN